MFKCIVFHNTCMPENSHREKQMTLMLLQESIWQLEDKINIILESIADHEAELIRLKRFTNLGLERLGRVESQKLKNKNE